jgi:hypothetical protein
VCVLTSSPGAALHGKLSHSGINEVTLQRPCVQKHSGYHNNAHLPTPCVWERQAPTVAQVNVCKFCSTEFKFLKDIRNRLKKCDPETRSKTAQAQVLAGGEQEEQQQQRSSATGAMKVKVISRSKEK